MEIILPEGKNGKAFPINILGGCQEFHITGARVRPQWEMPAPVNISGATPHSYVIPCFHTLRIRGSRFQGSRGII